MKDLVFVGIRGALVALDRTTGTERWRTRLKGQQPILFTLDGPGLYATANGEAFCLDAATGAVLWNNPLKGLGLGLATIALGAMPPEQVQALAAIRARQAQAAAGAAAAS
jgi:outer membrane protein assembly factor BamB